MQCYRDGKWWFYGGYGNNYPPCVRSGNFCDSDDDDEEADGSSTVIIIVIAAMVVPCVLFAVVFVAARSCKNQAANPRAAAFHGYVHFDPWSGHLPVRSALRFTISTLDSAPFSSSHDD